MKRFYFLVFTLLCSSAAISYSFAFDQLNKTPITDVKFAPFIVGGLGVLGFSYCAKDLWTVGKALSKGNEGVAELRVQELQQNLAKNRFNLTGSEIHGIEGEIELLRPGLIYQGNDGRDAFFFHSYYDNYQKEEFSIGKMFPAMWKKNKNNLDSAAINELCRTCKENSIINASNQYKWRAAFDGAVIVSALGAIGYAGYTLINK